MQNTVDNIPLLWYIVNEGNQMRFLRCFATIVRPLYGVLRYSPNATFIEKRVEKSTLFYFYIQGVTK